MITLCESTSLIVSQVVLLYSMNEQVTDISKILSDMSHKISSMEQTLSKQDADVSRFYHIIDQKDKRIHVLKKRLSKYEEPDKDSHNGILLHKNRFQQKPSVGQSLA